MKERLALLRNVALVTAVSYVESAVGLAVGVLIARTLGPSDYGHYAFAVWMCGVLIGLGNHALPSSSIRFLAEARGAGRGEVASHLIHRFLRLQTSSSVLVLAVFALAMWLRPLADWDREAPLMVGLVVVAVWSRAGSLMRGSIGKGFERFEPESVALALTAVLNLAVVVALALAHAGVTAFFASYAVLGFVSNMILRFMLARMGVRAAPGPIPADVSHRMRDHLWQTAVMMLLLLALGRTIEMALLKIYTTSEIVGYFAIAGTLTKGAVDLLAGGLSSVLMPIMSRRFGQGGADSLGPMFGEATRLYWFVGLMIAGLGVTVSEGLVHLLYGQRYDGAIPALMWHLVLAGFLVVNAAAAAALTSAGRQSDRIRIYAVALVVDLVLALVLVPRFGLPGALVSLTLTAAVGTVLSWRYAFRLTKGGLPWRLMARQLFAAAIATALGYAAAIGLANPFGFLVGAAVFLMAFLALGVRLGGWKHSDFELLAHLMGRVPRFGSGLSHKVLRMRRFASPEAGFPAAGAQGR